MSEFRALLSPWRPIGLAIASQLLCVGCLFSGARAVEPAANSVEFNRDIRPILSDACYRCHGPDSAQRKADLRLDTEDGAKADLGGHQAIQPGQAGSSELVRRITSDDPDERMPPPDAGPRLTEKQVALIRRWIDDGARWQKHWAYIAPQRPPLPNVKNTAWPRNEIDHFVLARLEHEGLAPSPTTDNVTLLRRITLDLTGLPPTVAEVEAFLADGSPDAYEKNVDRLLASPRYGERMAAPWLDAARYADTNGYQTDGERTMWRWRDWVIEALNRNMPFDQFTIEQLAGDMLPHPSLDQQIATGFNRNLRGNGEGGIIAEEFAAEYVVDRVETTGTVWLGLTFGCARCHDHKYDPVTQKEFYQLYAFFDQVPERGRAVKEGNSPPFILAPTREQSDQLAKLEAELAAAERRIVELQPQLVEALTRWEGSHPTVDDREFSIARDLAVQLPCEPVDSEKESKESSEKAHNDKEGGDKNLGDQERKFVEGEPSYAAGRVGKAYAFDGRRYVDCGNVADFGYYDKFTVSAWIKRDGESDGVLCSRMIDEPDGNGWNVQIVGGKLQVNLVTRWLDDALRVETVENVPANQWTHVALTYDGSRLASGVKLFVNGQEQQQRVLVDLLYQTFQSKEPFRLGAHGPAGRFHGCIDDVRIFRARLEPAEIELLATAATPAEILALPVANRTAQQSRKLQAYFIEKYADETIRSAHEGVSALRRQHEQLIDRIPTTMVMQESPERRDTFVLLRGRYDQPGEKVAPELPKFVATAGLAKKNRLGFARWLVDPSNPLTARVTVNRYWQMYFGTALVKTVDDFGAQGELPSHPELLDWLATEFMQNGWNMKALQRKIVTSAAYRQASRVAPELQRRDPDNRLIARGPRLRLSAEMIRDQVLAASELLDARIGGPSVKPYQPARLWMELTGTLDYVQSHGADLYRRSIYTYVKRTVAPPVMVTFDASPRETCSVRVTRTNTPLQALALMNDVTYVEAARVLAERVMAAAGSDPAERIALAFRRITARRPEAAELQTLVQNWKRQLAHFRECPQDAEALVKAGESPLKPGLDAGELAAYTTVANLIMNLDEAITKE